MSKQPAASGSKSPSQFHTDEGAKQSRSAAQKLQEKAVGYCQEPRFLRLFTPDKHDEVRTKLAAYHGRMGTELFVGLRDSVRFRMVTNSRFATFVPIAPEPAYSATWNTADLRQYGTLDSIWEEFQHLRETVKALRSGVAVEDCWIGGCS